MHKPVHNNSNVCDLLPNLHHSDSSLLLLLLLLYVQFKIQVVLYRSVDVYTNSRERERERLFFLSGRIPFSFERPWRRRNPSKVLLPFSFVKQSRNMYIRITESKERVSSLNGFFSLNYGLCLRVEESKSKGSNSMAVNIDHFEKEKELSFSISQ